MATISEADFINVWGAGAQDNGDLYEFDQVKDLDPKRVWTIVEGDNGDWIAAAGFHIVNKLGYVLSIKPWETGLEEAIWVENDFDEDEGLAFERAMLESDG